MSNWVYVYGTILINSITSAGLKKIYNLKNKKQIEKFYENSNNWKHTYSDDHLVLDHTDAIKKFFESIETPYGSEGHMEVEPAFYNRFLKIPGVKSSGCSSSMQDYNEITGELIPFGFGVDLPDDEYEKEGWKNIWFEENGGKFILSVFGELRDNCLNDFEKQFNEFLKKINKWFFISEILVKAEECWSAGELIWRFDPEERKIISYKTKI